MDYLKPKFSSRASNRAYRDNYDAVFRKRPRSSCCATEVPSHAEDCPLTQLTRLAEELGEYGVETDEEC